ncbi:hypothetical protein LINPERHAP1_LOCUS4941 [Linum perenne]
MRRLTLFLSLIFLSTSSSLFSEFSFFSQLKQEEQRTPSFTSWRRRPPSLFSPWSLPMKPLITAVQVVGPAVSKSSPPSSSLRWRGHHRSSPPPPVARRRVTAAEPPPSCVRRSRRRAFAVAVAVHLP